MNKGGFTRKKVKTLTLGERLLKMREDRHMTLSDISRNTGIQIAYLEYLEKGEFDKLPAEVYVRGFLRRYAEYLGVPEEPIVRQYERERGMGESLRVDERTERDSFERGAFQKIPSVLITPSRITATFFIVLALAGFLYVYAEYRQFISEPVLAVVEPAREVMTVENSFLYVAGKTDPDSRVYINDQPVLVSELGEFREKVEFQPGVNTLVIRSVNRFNREAKKSYSIDARFETPILEQEAQDNPEDKVDIRVGEDPVWILIVVDGEQKVSEVASPGASWEFFPKREMTLSAGDGRQVYVTIGEGSEEVPLSTVAGVIDEYQLDREQGVFVPPVGDE